MRPATRPLPTLSDGHVLLRPLDARDMPALEVGMRDPDVMRSIGPPEGSATEMLRLAEVRWAEGWPTLAICEPDGSCVGKAWVGGRDDDPSTGFVGYWLLPAARGRGLASAAVRLLARWASRELPITRVRLTAAPDNERSHRVAERSGFRRVAHEDGAGTAAVPDHDVVYELGTE